MMLPAMKNSGMCYISVIQLNYNNIYRIENLEAYKKLRGEADPSMKFIVDTMRKLHLDYVYSILTLITSMSLILIVLLQ